MTKKTTRIEQYTRPALFMAFDLGSKEWKLGFSTGFGQKPRIRTVPARNWERLQEEIAAARKRFALQADTPVISCYEAGRDGNYLHRYLSRTGVQNYVVDSSSIEVKRRARRAKSDKLDVGSLLRMLIRHYQGEPGVWSVVRVPSPEQEDQRRPHRELQHWKREQTASRNRIKGLLAFQGIRPSHVELSEQMLESMRTADGLPLQPGLKAELLREVERLKLIKRHIASLEKERNHLLRSKKPDRAVGQIKQLITLRGIGPGGSSVLVREIFDWRKFENQRQLGALTGFAPTPYSSGSIAHEQGISKAGIKQVRRVGVELAWSWLRHQPKSPLTEWFERRFAHGGKAARKVGIVAVARRLIIALWKFLEWGVIPEGAELKAQEV